MRCEEFPQWLDDTTHAEWVDGEVILLPPDESDNNDVRGSLIAILRVFVRHQRPGAVRLEPYQMKLGPDLLFGHMHNVRLMWLKASAPDLMEGLEKLEPKLPHSREALAAALAASVEAIGALVRQAAESGGTVKGFKPHAAAFLCYLVSHESHHRGQIEWALRHAGVPLPDSVSYGLWEWGSR